ncbi:MAG: hypothetical protein K9I34_03240 [Bacteroidales bacterium]|nr:hypothetical protein [Bacteroidales bacterium]
MEDKLSVLERKLTGYFWRGLIGLAVFFVLAGLQIMLDAPALAMGRKSEYYFSTLVIIATLILIPSGYYFAGLQARKSKLSVDEDMKLSLFERASLMKLIFFALTGMINILFYLLVGNHQTLLFIIIVFIVYLMSKPSKAQFENEFI